MSTLAQILWSKLKCKTRREEEALGKRMELQKFRICFRCWSLSCLQGALFPKTLSVPLTSSFFRGHQGLQDSQAQLGSLQW